MGQSYKTKLKLFASQVTCKTVVYICVCGALVAAGVAWWHGAGAVRGGGGPRGESLRELLPRPLHKYVCFADNYTVGAGGGGGDAERLRRLVVRLTYEECEIRHWKRFGPVQRDTPLVVVQVHRDAARLQYLVASLAAVRHIRTAMLVFSHSYYDSAINELVRAIDFCKVMQIFYPYSLQTHPDRFPGPDPDDCPPAGAGAGERRPGCVERDARRTERKQHWWWQARHVFESLEWSGAHRGMVVFVPEHAWLAPDALHMLAAAQRALAYFPRALLVALGGPGAGAPPTDYDLLAVDAWRPPYDVGLAFNRTAWRRIAALAEPFCMHDDTSWSYSLLHALRALPAGCADMVACAAPRVTSTRRATAARAALRRQAAAAAAARLFPRRARAVVVWGARPAAAGAAAARASPPRGAGGWADVRDQLFCIDPLINTGPPRDYADYSPAPAAAAAPPSASPLDHSPQQ